MSAFDALLARQEEQMAELHKLRVENAQLKQWQRDMVKKAADKSLDGYRELGARCADFERERDALKAERDAPIGVDAMLSRNGLYVCGDTKHPDKLVPIWVDRGVAHTMELDSPLSREGFLPTFVIYSGPHVAPAFYAAREKP